MKEIMDMLIVEYERTKEVKATKENNLNKKYKHFFAQRNEYRTQSFNYFNCLINGMRRFDSFKHEKFKSFKKM